VEVLAHGDVKILLLGVPWSQPPARENGSPSPAASPARHNRINALLRAAAMKYPDRVRFMDIDKFVSPGNHYQARINGTLCRFDGTHFTIYCARLLQPHVLGTVRDMIPSDTAPGSK
jgi:hypothetical protein